MLKPICDINFHLVSYEEHIYRKHHGNQKYNMSMWIMSPGGMGKNRKGIPDLLSENLPQ
jgi:hypothetical protein